MTERAIPPFRADHVGSLLRPPALLRARAARDARRDHRRRSARAGGRGDPDAVHAAGGDRARARHRRGVPAHLVPSRFPAGVCKRRGDPARAMKARFHTEQGEIEMQPPGLRVTGPISRPHPIFVEDFRFLHSVAKGMPKLTLPSPSMMHFRGGRRAIDHAIYPDIARVLCRSRPWLRARRSRDLARRRLPLSAAR